MEENKSQIDNKKYNRALFYDIFLGRPQQAEEIAEFVFWLHAYYGSISPSHPSNKVDKDINIAYVYSSIHTALNCITNNNNIFLKFKSIG